MLTIKNFIPIILSIGLTSHLEATTITKLPAVIIHHIVQFANNGNEGNALLSCSHETQSQWRPLFTTITITFHTQFPLNPEQCANMVQQRLAHRRIHELILKNNNNLAITEYCNALCNNQEIAQQIQSLSGISFDCIPLENVVSILAKIQTPLRTFKIVISRPNMDVNQSTLYLYYFYRLGYQVIKHAHSLESLAVVSFNSTLSTSPDFLTLANVSFPQLKELTFDNYPSSDALLMLIVAHAPQCTTINIPRLPHDPEEFIKKIYTTYPNNQLPKIQQMTNVEGNGTIQKSFLTINPNRCNECIADNNLAELYSHYTNIALKDLNESLITQLPASLLSHCINLSLIFCTLTDDFLNTVAAAARKVKTLHIYNSSLSSLDNITTSFPRCTTVTIEHTAMPNANMFNITPNVMTLALNNASSIQSDTVECFCERYTAHIDTLCALLPKLTMITLPLDTKTLICITAITTALNAYPNIGCTININTSADEWSFAPSFVRSLLQLIAHPNNKLVFQWNTSMQLHWTKFELDTHLFSIVVPVEAISTIDVCMEKVNKWNCIMQ